MSKKLSDCSLMFIAFEGIDGAGKSTLTTRIHRELTQRGFEVFRTHEPTDRIEWNEGLKKGRTAQSGIILFFRFTEDRFYHQEEIQRHLDEGSIVLCDRYIMSSLAYQGPLIETLFPTRDEAIGWMLSVSRIIKPVPDITFYIDVDPEISMQRLGNRKSLTGFEEKEYLRKVRDFYRHVAFPGKIVIDGSRSLEEVHSSVMEEVMKNLRQ